MAFDYKKEYKEFYMPKNKPSIVKIPKMNYIAVKGKGNPNQEDGEYKKSIGLLYAIAFTIKMSYKGDYKIEGYFDYVVPPLEGFWWNEGNKAVDYSDKEKFEWISMIRQPEFVTREVFDWACEEVKNKKGLEVSKAEFMELEEGLCVQMLHKGSYDEEPETIVAIEEYIQENQLKNDIGSKLENGVIRRHHEIYLSDPRKSKVENLKTVIRIPVVREKE